MTAGKAGAIYVVHYNSGLRSEPVRREDVRLLIQSGRVGVDDLVSRENGPPTAFYQYDEFVDLWDVDESFDFLMGDDATDPDPGPGPGAPVDQSDATDPDPGPGPGAPVDQSDEAYADFVDFVDDEATPVDASPSVGVGSAPNSPLSQSVEEDPEPMIAFEDIDAIAGFDEVDVAEVSAGGEDGWLEPVEAAGTDAVEGFSGYDPLVDLILDPMTVLELLLDSSLYTVLASNPGERGPQIEVRYRARADIMAKRQRGVPRSDQEHVQAMREIRQLVYKTYQVLRDERSRREYVETAAETGRPATAGQFLGLEQDHQLAQRPATIEPLPAPELLIAESLAELNDEDVEDLGEQGASLGFSKEPALFDPAQPDDLDPDDLDPDDLDPDDFDLDDLFEEPDETETASVAVDDEGPDLFGISDEIFAGEQATFGSTGSHAVDFSDESASYETEFFGTNETPAPGVRIYTSVSGAIDSGEHDKGRFVGDIFDAKRVPRRARIRRDTAAHRRVKMASRRGSTQSYSVTAAHEFPKGLRWGTDDNPAAGAAQAGSLAAVAFFLSLAVVVITDLGTAELDYSGHSVWFWGRGLLLIVLAVAGTLWLRGEPLLRLGLAPPIIETVMGLGVGVLLGLAASMIAPIYLDVGASLGAVLGGMFFIAVAHELFFRGFVTRVLLVGMPNPYVAILISCSIYGFFYLSYSAVLGLSGFWMLYYSILLYGFGLGSILAVLYWKSRSIWPSVMVHFLVLAFAALLAPGTP